MLFYSPNISYLCSDECVSPSLKSPNFNKGSIWRRRRQFITSGLLICAYRLVFGDTIRGVTDGSPLSYSKG